MFSGAGGAFDRVQLLGASLCVTAAEAWCEQKRVDQRRSHGMCGVRCVVDVVLYVLAMVGAGDCTWLECMTVRVHAIQSVTCLCVRCHGGSDFHVGDIPLEAVSRLAVACTWCYAYEDQDMWHLHVSGGS
jgi:hypothetical protein